MKYINYFLISFFFTSCASIKVPKDASIYDYFYVSESDDVSKSKWVIFLPGSSGLVINKDSTHYFGQAKKLNKLGYSVILVDYKKAYVASKRDVKESTGEKINYVLGEAIDYGKDKYDLKDENFAIVGWSLAGEGLCLLANDKDKLENLNISAIALFYPSNQEEVVVQSNLPILVQTGSSDGITLKDDILKTYSNNKNTEIIIFDDAHHGFDVESLAEGQSIRFPPVVGKKYIMKYDLKSAKESFENLTLFLEKI